MGIEQINLLTYGDDFEKVHYPKVEKFFPNYELFWKYIYDYREEGSIQIREDVPQLTLIFRYSYSIFFNLMKANLFREQFNKQSNFFENRYFDDFIVYLSSSLELTDKLLLLLFIFENSFDEKGVFVEDKIKDFSEELTKKIINKIEAKINSGQLYEDIKKNTLNFLLECNRGSVPIGNLDNVNQLPTIIEPFFSEKDKKLKRDFYGLKNVVTTYRNLIVHEIKNYLYEDNGEIYIPRPDKLKIHNKTKLKITKKILEKDFYLIKNLMQGQFISGSKLLNRIWQVFLIDLFERNKKVNYFYKSSIRVKQKIQKDSVYQTVSFISPIIYASDVVPLYMEGISYSTDKIDSKNKKIK